jgi:Lar family restriction alleviation protein
MAETLKPCPFCGGTNLATSYCAYTNMDHEFMPDTVHMHVFDLYCKECGCRVQAGGDTYYGAKDAVFEKWNRRAERTCRNVCEWSIATFHFTCSECGAEIDGDDWGDSPVFVGDYHEQLRYCPNCGARVVEE